MNAETSFLPTLLTRAWLRPWLNTPLQLSLSAVGRVVPPPGRVPPQAGPKISSHQVDTPHLEAVAPEWRWWMGIRELELLLVGRGTNAGFVFVLKE